MATESYLRRKNNGKEIHFLENLELKKTQSNKKVLDFSLASRRDRKTSNGEYLTDFIKCIAWEQSAEFLSKYANKGDLIGVVGRIETDNYTNKDGQKVYRTYVTCESVEIISKPQKQEGGPENQYERLTDIFDKDVTIETEDLPFY